MEKLKLAIVGVSVKIYYSYIKKLFNPSKYEIKAFLDNKDMENSLSFEQFPVCAYEVLNKLDVAIICIPDCIDYDKVINEIEGISPQSLEKCVVFKEDGTAILSSRLNNKVIDSFYELLINEKHNALQEKQGTLNLNSTRIIGSDFIAHAMGGWVKKEKALYTNSLDALETSIQNGIEYIEADLRYLNGDLIFCHKAEDLIKNTKRGYKIAYFNDLLQIMTKYVKIKAVLDIKDVEEYEFILDKILDQIQKGCFCFDIKKRLIVEAYNEQTVLAACRKGFECIHTNYREDSLYNHNEQALLCKYYGINNAIVLFGDFRNIAENMYAVDSYLNRDIEIFAATVNSVDKYEMLRKMGFRGVVTDWLFPSGI